MPIRAINEAFGLEVEWNQKSKTVTVKDGVNEKVFTLNSKKITINGESKTMDVAVKAFNGKTYVPLRDVAPVGSVVKWDNNYKQAVIYYNHSSVTVNTDIPRAAPKPSEFDLRMKTLSEKINETSNLSSIKQKRTYFKPYFTDRFINYIIQKDGLGEINDRFKDYGIDAAINAFNKNSAYDAQLIEDYNELKLYSRHIYLVKRDGVWKVDSISLSEGELMIR